MRKRLSVAASLLVITSLLLVACGGPTTPPTTSQPTAAAAPNVVPTAAGPAAATPVSYRKDVKPLLALKCAKCHSDHDIQSGFDVTSVAAMLKGGTKAGAALLVGKPDDSPLLKYLDGRLQPQMPKKGDPLKPAEIAMIRTWIAEGAIEVSTGSSVATAKTLSRVPARTR